MLVNYCIGFKDIAVFEFSHTKKRFTAKISRIISEISTFHMFSLCNRTPSYIFSLFNIATYIFGQSIFDGIEFIVTNILTKHGFQIGLGDFHVHRDTISNSEM